MPKTTTFTKGHARTMGGRQATIFTTNARGKEPIVGVIHYDTADEPASWTAEGKFLRTKDTVSDLVGSPLCKDSE